MSTPTLQPTFGEIETRLAAEGFVVVPTQGRPNQATDESLPWLIGAFIDLSPLVVALFLFYQVVRGDPLSGSVFLLASLSPIVGATLLAVGILLITATRVARRDGSVVRQLAVAATLAGEATLACALALSGERSDIAFALIAATAVLTTVRDPLVRFVSIVGAVAALDVTFAVTHSPNALELLALVLGAATGWVWISMPARLARRTHQALVPAAYALGIGFLSTLVLATAVDVNEQVGATSTTTLAARASGIVLGVGVLAIAFGVRREMRLGRPTRATIVAIASLALLAPAVPDTRGLVGAASVLLLGFLRRASLLVSIALVFLFFALAACLLNLWDMLPAKFSQSAFAAAALLVSALLILQKRGEARATRRQAIGLWSGLLIMLAAVNCVAGLSNSRPTKSPPPIGTVDDDPDY